VEHGENERSPLLLVIMRVKEMRKSYLPHLLKKTPCSLPMVWTDSKSRATNQIFWKKRIYSPKKQIWTENPR